MLHYCEEYLPHSTFYVHIALVEADPKKKTLLSLRGLKIFLGDRLGDKYT